MQKFSVYKNASKLTIYLRNYCWFKNTEFKFSAGIVSSINVIAITTSLEYLIIFASPIFTWYIARVVTIYVFLLKNYFWFCWEKCCKLISPCYLGACFLSIAGRLSQDWVSRTSTVLRRSPAVVPGTKYSACASRLVSWPGPVEKCFALARVRNFRWPPQLHQPEAFYAHWSGRLTDMTLFWHTLHDSKLSLFTPYLQNSH